MSPLPAPLPENAGLAFLGEIAWAPAQLTGRQAEKLLAAPNRCGRPNADVLHRRLAVVDHAPAESWAIDFPAHFTAQEAGLYEQPFARLALQPDWLNPHADPELRRALARLSRYLATPVHSTPPDWQWIDEDVLPDASLLVVAREDDCTHGVLSSSLFAAWQRTHGPALSSVALVAAFPFPWPPATGLNALTAAQEEHRHAIARAARSDDRDRLNAAVLTAYGWPEDLTGHEGLEKLAALNRTRAG